MQASWKFDLIKRRQSICSPNMQALTNTFSALVWSYDNNLGWREGMPPGTPHRQPGTVRIKTGYGIVSNELLMLLQLREVLAITIASMAAVP